MKLNELAPKEGSIKERRRVGRGIGSGMGKTSSKGQKGQKSRSGVAINGYEGGQMPLYQRLPKRGFNARVANNYAEVSLAKIQQFIDSKKLDTKGTIDEKALVEAGVVRRVKDGVRLLGNGELKTKVTLKITGATKSAAEAVEKAGGKVEIIDKSVKPVERKNK
jgi:large subunit ribosomal protein L15